MDIWYFLLVYFILLFTYAFWGVSYRVARRIQVQVRLEEASLLKEHGIVYQQYQLKTRRFL